LFDNISDVTLPLATWYSNTSVNTCVLSAASKHSRTPGFTISNASSVGAKTVNGPGPERVSTKSAAVRAATSVSSLAATAREGMSGSGTQSSGGLKLESTT